MSRSYKKEEEGEKKRNIRINETEIIEHNQTSKLIVFSIQLLNYIYIMVSWFLTYKPERLVTADRKFLWSGSKLLQISLYYSVPVYFYFIIQSYFLFHAYSTRKKASVILEIPSMTQFYVSQPQQII